MEVTLLQSSALKPYIADHNHAYPKLLFLAHAAHVRRVGSLYLAERGVRDIVTITAGALECPAFASEV